MFINSGEKLPRGITDGLDTVEAGRAGIKTVPGSALNRKATVLAGSPRVGH